MAIHDDCTHKPWMGPHKLELFAFADGYWFCFSCSWLLPFDCCSGFCFCFKSCGKSPKMVKLPSGTLSSPPYIALGLCSWSICLRATGSPHVYLKSLKIIWKLWIFNAFHVCGGLLSIRCPPLDGWYKSGGGSEALSVLLDVVIIICVYCFCAFVCEKWSAIALHLLQQRMSHTRTHTRTVCVWVCLACPIALPVVHWLYNGSVVAELK